MKKLLTVLGILFGLLLAAIIIIPLVVDVDQYRPKILAAANQKINGKLELGKLSLSLWGTIKVDIAGLTLSDAQNRKIVSVQSAAVRLPWTSIFGGSPALTLAMDQPAVAVVKDPNGKMNVLTLMKEAPPGSTNSGAPGAAGSGSTELPSMVTNARIGIELQNASVLYSDLITKNDTKLQNLNLSVKDLSLSRPTEIELSGNLESEAGQAMHIAGPFKVEARMDPEVQNGVFVRAKLDANINLDDLVIEVGQMFAKQKGVAAQAKGVFVVSKSEAQVEKLDIKFFNAEIAASGRMTGVDTETPSMDFKVQSNEIDLKPWNALVPMLKEYDLSGKMKFSARAQGPSAKLSYDADLLVQALKMKAPMLKAQPEINIELKVVTDQIQKLMATLRAPGNDVTIEGSVASLSSPRLEIRATSNSLDLDQLMDFPEPKEAAKAETAAAPAGKGAGGKSAPASDLDKMLDPIRKNPIMTSMVAFITVNMKMIKAKGMVISDLQSKLSMKNLAASIDSASMRVFGGSVTAKGGTNMKPATPTYTYSAAVNGLDLQKAVESKMAMFKNTVIGKLTMKIDGSGASYNPDSAMKNLSAKGSLRVDDAVFQSIDVAQVTTEAINKAIDQIAEKYPKAKGKQIKGLPEKSSKYEFLTTDFTISNGRFSAPNFVGKAVKNTGVDIKGSTAVGLIDQELQADWQLIDTWNLTKGRDVDVEVEGVQIPHILAQGDQPITIPISIGCKYVSPCVSYKAVPEHFMKIALNNAKTAAVGKVKQEAKAKAQEVLKEKVAPKAKELLKGIFGK